MVPIPIPRNLCGMLFVSMCPSALCECPAGLDLTLYLGLDVVFFFHLSFYETLGLAKARTLKRCHMKCVEESQGVTENDNLHVKTEGPLGF